MVQIALCEWTFSYKLRLVISNYIFVTLHKASRFSHTILIFVEFGMLWAFLERTPSSRPPYPLSALINITYESHYFNKQVLY